MGVHSEKCKVGLTRQIADFPIALGEILYYGRIDKHLGRRQRYRRCPVMTTETDDLPVELGINFASKA